MERFYRFGGVDIEISIPRERMFEKERRLAPFAAVQTIAPHRFVFEFVQELDPPSGNCLAQVPEYRVYAEKDWTVRYIGSVQDSWELAYLRAEHRGKEHLVQVKASVVPDRIGVHTVLGALGAEHLIVRAGGVILHASYIAWNGKAILFTAPSETGKSTQAELWRTLRGAEIINGDRAAIRMEDGKAAACGIPFAGSSEYCKNVTLPLAAIVYLGQAPRTSIQRLRGFQAFRRVWEGCSVNTWDKTDMELATDLVMRTVEAVPVFRLECTPDESAVIALEEMLRE